MADLFPKSDDKECEEMSEDAKDSCKIQRKLVAHPTLMSTVSTCARDAGRHHGDVLNVRTVAFWMDSRRFFSTPHHNATSHGDGQRESEDKERERLKRLSRFVVAGFISFSWSQLLFRCRNFGSSRSSDGDKRPSVN